MTPSELWDQLNQHDWYYAFSDDGRVYDAGRREAERLVALAKSIEGGVELKSAFGRHYFPSGSRNNPPLPERPTEPNKVTP